MSTLYIITGPPGVGKTTISKGIAKAQHKSALIEGDDIYHQVVASYTPAWKEGNHLDIFWKICIDSIQTYLSSGYDVIFNYIVTLSNLHQLTKKFIKHNIKFVILTTDENTLLKRDKQRPKENQMQERCLTLLKKFKTFHFDQNYFLDTSQLSIPQTIKIIQTNNKFILNNHSNNNQNNTNNNGNLIQNREENLLW